MIKFHSQNAARVKPIKTWNFLREQLASRVWRSFKLNLQREQLFRESQNFNFRPKLDTDSLVVCSWRQLSSAAITEISSDTNWIVRILRSLCSRSRSASTARNQNKKHRNAFFAHAQSTRFDWGADSQCEQTEKFSMNTIQQVAGFSTIWLAYTRCMRWRFMCATLSEIIQRVTQWKAQ